MDHPILQFAGIQKSFFGTCALDDVGFSLAKGQVLGLVGENGAGKSTLINILGGVLTADSGQMLLDAAPYTPRSPSDAAQAGVALVHQELNLFSNLSIAENLFLTDLPRRRMAGLAWIDRSELRRRSGELLKTVQLLRDPETPVGMLSPGERQLVEIAKALYRWPRILVFDEPTTSLTKPEAARLFEIIRRMRDEGSSVIYVSHNLSDVLRLCDQIVVLRDGRVQAMGPKEDFSIERMISLMVGRSLERLYPARDCPPSQEKLLEVHGLSRSGIVEDITFTLHGGEVLGISGLMGSGRTELARILFGLDGFGRGEISVLGKPLRRPSPRKCIARGMAFLTEDRRGEGLLMEATIEENVALVRLEDFALPPLGLLRRGRIRKAVRELTTSLGIDCRDAWRQPVKTLSGGNQQKVVLAKWLASRARILILDEPTRGIDVGAKYDLCLRINELVAQGAGILLISSELEELVGLCDRILVMARGEVQSVVDKGDFDRHEMLRSALGEERLE